MPRISTQGERNTALNKDFFLTELSNRINNMQTTYIDINAGSFYREFDDAKTNNHSVTTCCDVMINLMQGNDAKIAGLHLKKRGMSLTIRYFKENH